MDEPIDVRRKRLRFRSWYRGTKEIELMLGRFADAHLDRLTPEQLDGYEALLANPDPDLYQWINGEKPAPASCDGGVLKLLRNFTYQSR